MPPAKGVKSPGADDDEPGFASAMRSVPATVPSLNQGSPPPTPDALNTIPPKAAAKPEVCELFRPAARSPSMKVPFALASVTQGSKPVVGRLAMKNTLPFAPAVKSRGSLDPAPATRSAIIRVPPAVPSLNQGSAPCTPSSARNASPPASGAR